MERKIYARGLILTLCTLGLLFSAACSKSPANKIDGNYKLFIGLRPHSQEIVRLDIYEDFTCPACQQFSNDFLPLLKKAYGPLIEIHMHYMVGSKSPISAQVLYNIAESKGFGEKAASRLFAAHLDHHDSKKNDPIVNKIAADLGVQNDYQRELNNPDMIDKIHKTWNTEGAFVTFFPSVIVSGRLLTNGNPDNLHTIINSLLKHPRVRVSVKKGLSVSTDANEGDK